MPKESEAGSFVIRHPIIARFVVENVAPREILAEATIGFLRAISTVLPPPGRPRRQSRAFGVYRGAINHKRMQNLFPGKYALVCHIYESIQDLFSDEGHYWLQYGSYELVLGDSLDKAENYINQAAALLPNSVQVTTATAHLILKKSLVANTFAAAEALMEEASKTLQAQRELRSVQLHPYHIFGTQLMAYIRTWVPEDERSERYHALYEELRRAIPIFLRSEVELRRLLETIKRAELETVAPRRN